MELIRRFDAETWERGMGDWGWLLAGRPFAPLAASAFGDVFLQGSEGIWFLDTIEGTLERRWPDVASLQTDLHSPEGQDRYLLGGLVAAAAERGVVPGPQQVLAFTLHPVLGGAISVDNVETLDFVVAASIFGQLHQQVGALPPGTAVTGLTIED